MPISSTVGLNTLVFESTNPYKDEAWSNPTIIKDSGRAIDPDIFWDEDGSVYIANSVGGIWLYSVDLATGLSTSPVSIWNGTGGRYPEGPHLYKRDGYYYLLIAEGGTELGHAVTIARSRKIFGPYESFSGNPILTNRNTTEYFQTVGHADLFQDGSENWWGVALSTRSGPAWTTYPMGRETILFPARWEKEQWPVLQPVRGRMTGWQLPKPNRNIPGTGSFVEDPDIIDFGPGSSLPKHLVHWRLPQIDSFAISPPHHPNCLCLAPSKANLTGPYAPDSTDAFTFLARRQTHTLFTYSVDVEFSSEVEEEEVGVTAFLTQYQHIDLGIVLLPSDNGSLTPQLRFRTTGFGKAGISLPETLVLPIPAFWLKEPVQLQIDAKNESHYIFSAAPRSDSLESQIVGYADVTIVSGGSGPFTG